MFKDKTIRNAVLTVIDEQIESQQSFYDSECKVIDNQLDLDIIALTDKAEENKKEMVKAIVKKIVSKLLD